MTAAQDTREVRRLRRHRRVLRNEVADWSTIYDGTEPSWFHNSENTPTTKSNSSNRRALTQQQQHSKTQPALTNVRNEEQAETEEEKRRTINIYF